MSNSNIINEESTKRIYLLRHGNRRDFRIGENTNAVPLNSEGKKSSYDLGLRFNEQKIDVIYSSPIFRCIETARYFTKGYGKKIPMYSTEILGGPSIYIHNIKQAVPVFQQMSTIQIINSLYEEKKLPGFMNYKLSSSIFLQFLNELPNGNYLLVSHDIVIALFTAFCLQKGNASDFNPDFLEGPQLNWLNFDNLLVQFKNKSNLIKSS